MRENDTFAGAYKTKRGSYKDFNELRALWFSDGFKNSYRMTKEKIKDKWYFIIYRDGEYKPIIKIEMKGGLKE